jgi:hypothetical protein
MEGLCIRLLPASDFAAITTDHTLGTRLDDQQMETVRREEVVDVYA